MKSTARTPQARNWALIACLLVACACGSVLKRHPQAELPPIKLLAVLPVEAVVVAAQPKAVDVEVPVTALPANAGLVVSAQIYGVMAEGPRWRFVPDLVVEQALRDLPADGSLEARAAQLGKAVGADGVLYGSVSRLREREGSEYGARRPASVSFRLALLAVASGQTVWQGSFDQTQQSLSANLFNWWMFWRAGPRWFTAAELTRLGVEQQLAELERLLE
ncbi:MAG: hypothetical protein HY699_02750 [Deltaproteobacteria bacterium]|nr:hypothetical protein [Deltaproteobacteria bacterium]